VKKTPFLFWTILVLAAAQAADTPKVRPPTWAQPVLLTTLDNLYRVSDDLFRSEQPRIEDIASLKALGVRTVLSLRHYHNDSEEFEREGIRAAHYRMDAGTVSEKDLIAVLHLIQDSPKPVLLHCWHGSDRTGFIVAGYRMVMMNWSAEQAVEEMRLGGFGFHESYYQNIITTLAKIDVQAVRKAVLSPLPDQPPPPPHNETR